jgi:predicted nucleotidyltransferase
VELRAYLEALNSRTRAQLGPSLVAVSLVGSAGAGWYEPGVSDVDVAVVVNRALNAQSARALAAKLSH